MSAAGRSRARDRRQAVRPGRPDLPLAEYAAIGDGHTVALVARDGSVDWLCHGRFDGPAVFCRLLDRERGGYFQVAPEGRFRAERRYLGGTNVLVTDFECASGAVRLTDAMPLGSEVSSTLIRKLEGRAGRVPVRVELVSSFDYARAATRIDLLPDSGCTASAGQDRLTLACPGRVVPIRGGVVSRFELEAGQTQWITSSPGGRPLGPSNAAALLDRTIDTWTRWTARGRYAGPYAELLQRSALVLEMLIHRPTRAIVAAPTTSLPEDPGGERNWDYRFVWLRDASWVVSALMDLGYHEESMGLIDWLESLGLGRTMPSVFYDLDGRVPSEEEELEHLRGWRDSRPVRVGNAAARQDQHDVLGEVAGAILLCSEGMPSMRPLRPGLWSLVSRLADLAVAHWRHADRGPWEVRDRPRHFVTSKLLCWSAIDCALTIARRDGLGGPIDAWSRERARIRAAIEESGFDAAVGAFVRAFGDTALDASALLIPRYRFLPATDPRMQATVNAVRGHLSCGKGLLRRYRAEDGLAGDEGAFTACSFWLVDCLARSGRIDEAFGIFEQVASHANDVGLLSEEIAPADGSLIGNFPQAFTHLALIRAATALSDAEQAKRSPGPLEASSRR